MAEMISNEVLSRRLMAYVQGALTRMAYGSAGCIEDMHVFELLRDQGMLQRPETMEEEARQLLHHWFPLPAADPAPPQTQTFAEAMLECAARGALTESMAREWLEGEDLERALALLKTTADPAAADEDLRWDIEAEGA